MQIPIEIGRVDTISSVIMGNLSLNTIPHNEMLILIFFKPHLCERI